MPSKKDEGSGPYKKTANIEEVINSFDSKYSYILFERSGYSQNDIVFSNLIKYLKLFKSLFKEIEYYYDKQDKIYLLLKVEPRKCHFLTEKLAGTEIFRDFPFYIYEAPTKT